MSKLLVSREDAVLLCVGLGYATASEWPKKQMLRRLQKLSNESEYESLEVDENIIEDEEDRDRLNSLLVEIRAVDEIGVSEKPADKAKDEVKDADDVDVSEDSEDEEVTDKPAKPAKKEKAAKPAKEDKEPGPAGVRLTTKGRSYYAGVLLAKYGWDNGVTKEMAEELEGLYNGKTENVDEALYVLRNVWHAIRGYREASA